MSAILGPDGNPISGYDGAQDSTVRSALIFPRNSRVEHSPITRRKLLEKARGLEANLPLLTRIKSKFRRYAVGKGIMPQPVTGDDDWNKAAKLVFERWFGNPAAYSIDASRDGYEDQGLLAEALTGDGEFFEALARREGAPMVQPLDPFEFETPPEAREQYEDAVRFDTYLRPLAYACKELPAPGIGYRRDSFREIRAADLIHLFRRRRAKQFRGLPPIFSGLNIGIDALDTLALENITDKLHSALGISVTRKDAGGVKKGVTGNLEKTLDADGKITKVEETFWQGAGIIELKDGEQLNLHASDRPGRARLEGLIFGFRLVALGHDLPLSVIFSFAELGGVPTRAELEDAQSSFECLQDVIVWRHSQRLYTWRLAIAMNTGELRRCRDPYWWAADWHGPAKITVDLGRTADANISLSRNLMMSHERYWEERGGNAYDEARKEIRFRRWLAEQCELEGGGKVTPEMLIEPTPGAVTKVNVNQPEE